jgi:hypothetical protein
MRLGRPDAQLSSVAPEGAVLGVRPDVHSMRGVTAGVVRIGAQANPKFCVVIGHSFPSWILHVRSLGLKVGHLLLRDTQFGSYVYSMCGPDVRIWSGSSWGTVIASWGQLGGAVIGLVEGRVTASLLSSLSGVGITDVYSTNRTRKEIPGWFCASVIIKHTEVGGLTEALLWVVRHSRGSLIGLPRACPPVVRRDATTVLSHSLFGTKFRAKPKEVFLQPLCCLNLGTQEHPFYHGQGWLPAIINRQVRVATPVLNSGCHGGKWGV